MKNKRYSLLNTVYQGYNYGSSLQAFALKKFLEEHFDCSCEIISNKENGLKKYLFIFKRKFIVFMNCIKSKDLRKKVLHKKKTETCEFDPITKTVFDNFTSTFIQPKFVGNKKFAELSLHKECLCCITGSDQVWNPSVACISNNNFLFYSRNSKNISYAASFGQNFIPNFNKRAFKRLLKNISHFSVREETGKAILKKEFNIDSELVLDPTLLVGPDFWDKYLININCKNFIFCYFLNAPSEAAQKAINEYKKKGIKIYCVSRISHFKDVELLKGLNPFEFLSYIKQSNCVLTDSYHGMILSIMFSVDFYVFNRDYQDEHSQVSRISDFLKRVNLFDRFIEKDIKNNLIDYKLVQSIIEKERNESVLFLERSILGNE